MGKLLIAIVVFLTQKVRTLLVITFVLLLGSWLQHEWQALEKAQNDVQRQQQVKNLLQARHEDLIKAQQKTEQASTKLLTQFETVKSRVVNTQNQLQQLRETRQAIWDENWLARKNPASAISQQLREYDIKIAALSSQLRISQQTLALWQNNILQAPEIAQNKQLQQQIIESKQVLLQLNQSIEQSTIFVKTSLVNRLHQAVMQVLPTALILLLSIIFIPILLKLFQYFIVAPLVSRLPPIRVFAQTQTPPPAITVSSNSQQIGHVSSHSLTLKLSSQQELLLHPDYLQSFSKHAQKTTQWFLNARIPFSSWAAGLVTLVRLHSDQDETVQLAAMHNALEELVIINLPAGATLVCKPRCLAGVIKQREQAVKITRHWRLFNLHSWLTLQLRYLVFHGECQLIIKGHHGVILEHAGAARLIQQNATLGFSTDVAYSNYRCETFISYYLDKDSLFNDQFNGESGIYFYEQAPHDSRKAALVGKAVGGVWDAVLKVFGI
ncbi:MAG: hypothetical protein KBF23_07005 [Agitococcus sp.]|nr:hypothetical protein [Moraxellaceae bacterium]MBK7299155.1 hypothetical protein [Moraxellaceae bacterium]MBK9184818.1 hypothetical protein [Moraxellaceae bacterium]MBP9216901.1 hypothetical protein [Agitococcus sp.]MCC6374016.1 hypothetical protein [Moraxellaceae bacterium]